MAKVTGVFTGIKGKVGNVVFSMWKGVQVMKTYVIPENPRSEGQTKNRTVFASFINLFKPIYATVLFRFWKPFAVGAQTGWGNLISANQSLQSGGVFALANVLFSKGSIPLQEVDTADYVSETGVVTVTWTENEAVGCDALDHAVLLIYDETTEQLYGLTNDTSREAEELSEVVGAV